MCGLVLDAIGDVNPVSSGSSEPRERFRSFIANWFASPQKTSHVPQGDFTPHKILKGGQVKNRPKKYLKFTSSPTKKLRGPQISPK
jgi:hypothetical protein